MAQGINWDWGSGTLTSNLSNLVRLTCNFTQPNIWQIRRQQSKGNHFSDSVFGELLPRNTAMPPSSKWRRRWSAPRYAGVRGGEFWAPMEGLLAQRESHFSKLLALKINQILSQGMATPSPSQTVNSLWWEAEMDWKKKILREEKHPNEGTSGETVGSERPLGMH